MNVQLGSVSPTQSLELPLSTFLRHMVCLGSSGSGKTVAAKVVCEEFVRNGIPVIAVDPQGDIASLAIPGTAETIESKGLPASMLEEYKSRAEVVIWTPASSVGVPMSVNPLEALDHLPKDGEERIRALSGIAANLASLLGYEPGSDEGKSVVGFLHLVFENMARNEVPIRTFSGLAGFLAEQPPDLALLTAPICEERRQMQLRRKIQLLSIGASQLLFQMGVPLSIPTLLGKDDSATPGKTRVSVIYLNSLHSQPEKEFLLAQLAQALYDWMLDHPSTEPQALFYVDEVAPYLPPVRKPACKDALTLLLRQARKYGVCCLLASQNPGDVDYKCLAQISTWNLGRMMVRQDIEKVEKTVQSIAGPATEAIVNALPKLSPGEFRLLSPDTAGAQPLKVRWLLTEHKTLDEDSIGPAIDPALRTRLMTKVRPPIVDAPLEPAAAVEEEPEDESAGEAKPSPDVVLERLRHSRRAWTVKDLADDLQKGENAIRKALEDSRGVAKEKGGRSNWYWAKEYDFFPDYGILQPVHVAGLKIYERDALATATAATSALFGLVTKAFEGSELRHLPLWQIHLTVKVTKGMLFWKEVQSRGEFLYFHAKSGDLLLATKDGIRFVSVVDQDPAEIKDLDDICRFEEKTPDEVGLDRKTLKPLLAERDMVQLAQRKFPIRAEACRMTFLPYWRFRLAGENRAIDVDGVLGKILEG